VKITQEMYMQYQSEVMEWLEKTFGNKIAYSKEERSLRFLEEALELVQSTGMPKEKALEMLDYVYSRPVGDLPQEVGGVYVCLAALCGAHKEDMEELGKRELERVRDKSEEIKRKHESKTLRI
jgi:hypothetical protein